MTSYEAGFKAGVEAMRDQVLAYLRDPRMREGFVTQGPRVLVSVSREIEAMHPGSVKSNPPPMSRDFIGIIKRVREATKAGLSETKKACEDAEWDEAKAIKALGGGK